MPDNNIPTPIIVKDLKIDQLKKFYEIFGSNYVGAFINEIGDNKSEIIPYDQKYISKWEDFLAFNKKYNSSKYTLYACYRKLKPTIERNAEQVIFHRYFFVDIDEPGEESKFEEFIIKNNLKYSYKAISGRGLHYYFRTNDITIPEGEEGNKELEKLKATSSLFRDWFIDNDIKIDSKIIDLARYSRAFGTFNYVRGRHCELIKEYELTQEEIDNNTKIVFSLKPKYSQEFKATNTICSSCAFIEKAMDYNFELENPAAYVNDKLLKNGASYLVENRRSYNEAKNLTKTQSHTVTEMEGWWKKAEKGDMKFNCFELRKFCKESFPKHWQDTCLKCMFENKNKVLYINDDTLNFKDLKEEYRQTFKFSINKFYKIKGEIKDNIEYKQPIEVGLRYTTTLGQTTDEKTLELKDLKEKKDMIVYFDENKLSKQDLHNLKLKMSNNLVVDFFIYDFIFENKKIKLLSEFKLNTGNAIVEGNITHIKDKIKIGEETKLISPVPYFFAHTVQSAIIKYESWEDVFKDFKYTDKEISEYIFTKEDSEDEKYVLEYPNYFKWIIKAFLFSGLINKYPLHLVIVGPQGTGKSWLLEAINKKFFEQNQLISGGATTVKAFIPACPSGKYSKGYIYNAKNIMLVDEMFNIFNKATKDREAVGDEIASMNNILENLSLTNGSAFGSHDETLTAKTLWVTNPVDRTHLDFIKSVRMFPQSTMQRFLFFNMNRSFVDYIRDNKLTKLEEQYEFNKNKWIMLMNFFMSNKSKIEYDHTRIDNITKKYKDNCPADLQFLYEVRLTNHHAKLLFLGLANWRILFQKDKELKAKEDDYVLFEEVWEYLINSWKGDSNNILSKNENILLDMIPEDGINKNTLIARAEKVFVIDYKQIQDMIKNLRYYGKIKNGDKDATDKHNIYKITEIEYTMDNINDPNQLKLQ
jgi:hypothetical protein